MCTCIEEIKKEIATMQKESASMLGKVSDKDINNFLDAIIGIQHDIKDLNKQCDNLYTLLINNFAQITSSEAEIFANELKPTITSSDKLYITLRNSKWYSGIKNDLKSMRVNIDNIKEIYNDMTVFKVQLPANNQYKSIVNKLNTL